MEKNVEKLVEDGIKMLNMETKIYYANLSQALYSLKQANFLENNPTIKFAEEEYKRLEEKRIDRGLEETEYEIPPRKIKELLNEYTISIKQSEVKQ